MRGNRSEQSGRGKWGKPAGDRGLVKLGRNWYIRFSANGKMVTEKVGPSEARARKALLKRRAAIIDGEFFPNEVKKNVSFAEIVDDCLKRDLANFVRNGHDRRRKFRDTIHHKDRVRAMVKLDEKTRGCDQAFHWHDLRHTFASRLVMAGVDILTVKELMRHKTLDVTLRYAHLAPSHLVEALDKLDHYNAEKCKGSVMAGERATIPATATVN